METGLFYKTSRNPKSTFSYTPNWIHYQIEMGAVSGNALDHSAIGAAPGEERQGVVRGKTLDRSAIRASPGSGERQHAVSGKALDHWAIKVGRCREYFYFWKYFTHISIYLKTYVGEMLIRRQTRTLLQICCELLLY